ncbi:MAG: hypothetical protein M3680_12865 [Myxococcota bacterium]|nr:hypothetical protein [Myxococcota bacterium]
MHRFAVAVVITVAAGCTPRAVTPPARTLVMQSAALPEPGHQDVQVEVSRIGTIWGPELVGGGARLRHTVASNVALEADAGLLRVINAGDGGNRNAHTGRLGVVVTLPDQRLAVGGGIGGGYSATAGSWGTVDVGAVLSGKHQHVRPQLGGTFGYGTPLGDQTFTVSEPDGSTTELRLPRNTFAQVNAGLELGPRRSAVLVGASMIRFSLHESDFADGSPGSGDDLYLALGIGVRIVTD